MQLESPPKRATRISSFFQSKPTSTELPLSSFSHCPKLPLFDSLVSRSAFEFEPNATPESHLRQYEQSDPSTFLYDAWMKSDHPFSLFLSHLMHWSPWLISSRGTWSGEHDKYWGLPWISTPYLLNAGVNINRFRLSTRWVDRGPNGSHPIPRWTGCASAKFAGSSGSGSWGRIHWAAWGWGAWNWLFQTFCIFYLSWNHYLFQLWVLGHLDSSTRNNFTWYLSVVHFTYKDIQFYLLDNIGLKPQF